MQEFLLGCVVFEVCACMVSLVVIYTKCSHHRYHHHHFHQHHHHHCRHRPPFITKFIAGPYVRKQIGACTHAGRGDEHHFFSEAVGMDTMSMIPVVFYAPPQPLFTNLYDRQLSCEQSPPPLAFCNVITTTPPPPMPYAPTRGLSAYSVDDIRMALILNSPCKIGGGAREGEKN